MLKVSLAIDKNHLFEDQVGATCSVEEKLWKDDSCDDRAYSNGVCATEGVRRLKLA